MNAQNSGCRATRLVAQSINWPSSISIPALLQPFYSCPSLQPLRPPVLQSRCLISQLRPLPVFARHWPVFCVLWLKPVIYYMSVSVSGSDRFSQHISRSIGFKHLNYSPKSAVYNNVNVHQVLFLSLLRWMTSISALPILHTPVQWDNIE